MKHTEKIVRMLAAVFVMVLSMNVLFYTIPETKWVQSAIDSLEKSQDTIMTFSGTINSQWRRPGGLIKT